ncbi:LEM domain-containing protein 1 [Struthio camelus]|uniref:LEM domain-containing protein 1 n=1 Tax=Struthio camelus TaxID=8801 RepID=UPI0036040488
MAQVTVGVLVKEPEENVDQPSPEELDVKRLSDSELQEQLILYGAEPGPILPSTRTLYENKLLQLMDQSTLACCSKPDESEHLDQSSEDEDQEEQERSAQVILETKDFKVTAACASGHCKPSYQEVPERHKKLLSPNADHSLAKIMAELEQILPEDKLLVHRTQGQKRSGGSSPKAVRRTKAGEASSDGTGKDDKDETWFADPWSSIGISRKRPEKEDGQSSAQKNMETFKVEKERFVLEKENYRARAAPEETSRSLIPMPVRIAIFAIFVFVLFVYVTMEIDPNNPLINFILRRG